MNYHSRWYHYLVVVFFYLITSIITYSFIYEFSLDHQVNIYLRIIISTLFFVVVIMIMLSHTHAMISNNAIEEVSRNDDCIFPNSCDKCCSERPQRSHHCRVCNVCIRRMDHHCPWIANCVGELNQKSFFLLLFYSIIGTGIAFLSTMKSFIEFVSQSKGISRLVNNINLLTGQQNSIADILQTISVLGFIISGIMAISISILLSIQVNELRCGMTAIELKTYPKNDECPYYNYDLKTNFIILFGSNMFLWFVPINTFNQCKDTNQINNNYIALN